MNITIKTFLPRDRDIQDPEFEHMLYRYKLMRALEFRSDTIWQHVLLTVRSPGKILHDILRDFDSLSADIQSELREVLDNFFYKGELARGTYLAFYNGEDAIGAGFFLPRKDEVGQVHQIVVREFYRRRGLGSQLMNAIESAMIASGLTVSYAHARSYLQKFYERLGYELIDRSEWKQLEEELSLDTTHQTGVPHVLMKKVLKK